MARLPKIIYPPDLPILEKRQEIVTAIRRHPVVVITGETGSGKSTQLPKMCLEAGRGVHGMIACTQPRRIAATTVARRIAEELGEELGRSVGYKIRFDNKTPPDVFVSVMTDGILLMEAQQDPRLRSYDTIIVDEAHERSLNIDILLGILRTLIPNRPELRVLITSATIDTKKFAQAFDNAPIIEASGRLYPVEVRYRPIDVDSEDKGEVMPVDSVVDTVEEIIRGREPGDILVFMPTERDIREACLQLAGRCGEGVEILPLFSRLTIMQQQRVFLPTRTRKVVVATNVAETSITIPGIRFVVDTGLARIATYNPRSRTNGLPVRPISRSSADQRKGRAGRVQKGICIRLYEEADYLSRSLFTPPEILRSNLAGVILRMLSLGLGDVDSFPFIDPPPLKSIRDGIDILQELGAIEPADRRKGAGSWQLTGRGRIMARIPLDPRISRMILEADKEGCLQEMVIIAAALSIQDPRERPTEKEGQADQAHARFKDPTSDFSALLALWQHCYGSDGTMGAQNPLRRFCHEHFLSYRRVREWRDIRDQILSILAEQRIRPRAVSGMKMEGAKLYVALHRSILSGYLAHIAVKKEKNLYTATQGRQAMLFPGSGLFNRGGNWIVAAELIETSRLFARTVANIDVAWLEELGGNLCRRTYSNPRWEKQRGEVVVSEQVTLFGLTIVSNRSVSFGRIDPDEAARIFIRDALVAGEIPCPLPFLTYNLKLIERISEIEERIRRRNLLVGEEAIARFYELRLPNIFDIRSLQRLIRDRGNDAFLRMSEADVLLKPPDPEEVSLYPEKVTAGGWSLDCLYRFDPGKPLDGITLRIPVPSIPSLVDESFEWAIPGLLREKIMGLLRSLPKFYRKQLQPLEKTCRESLAEMERVGSLPTSLGRFIYKRYGIDIPARCWQVDQLDDHLKLRLSVVDERNRELAAGRDLALLKQRFEAPEEPGSILVAKASWERTGLTDWTFGDLPDIITIPIHGRGGNATVFPALVAEPDGVALRLFRSSEEARAFHPKGVSALMALKLRDDIRHLRKAVTVGGDIQVWSAAFGGLKSVESAILGKVLADLCESDLRTQEAFRDRIEFVRGEIRNRGLSVLSLIGPPVKALYEVMEKIRTLEVANRNNVRLLSFLNDLRNEARQLMPLDFLIRYDEQRIIHFARYLRAISIRAERGGLHLEKSLERGREIARLAQWHESTVLTLPIYGTVEKRQALENFFWSLQEYKVSLFAQELKTAIPISRKRIEALKAEIERML